MERDNFLTNQQSQPINPQLLQTKTKTIDLARIVDKVDIVSLALEYGLDLIQQTNGEYICVCPFHADVNPSMRIYPDTNTFYCATPDTQVLRADLTWTSLGNLTLGDEIVGVDEYIQGKYRHLRRSSVQKIRRNFAECLEITTTIGKVVVTRNHQFLSDTSDGTKWKDCNLRDTRFRLPQGIKQLFSPDPFEETFDYKLGYLQGYYIGDGSFRYIKGQRSYPLDPACWFTIASKDNEGIEYIWEFLKSQGVAIRKSRHVFGTAPRKIIPKIDTRKLADCEKIRQLLTQIPDSLEYKRGFLAGIFDAEGTCSGTETSVQLGIYNSDLPLLKRVTTFLDDFGFTTYLDKPTAAGVRNLRVKGGVLQILRFMTTTRPKILRKGFQAIENRGICNFGTTAKILNVKSVGVREIVEIETSTCTLITNGLVSHNCFGCQAGASIFEFVMRMENIEFKDALHRLAERAGYDSVFVLRDIQIHPVAENFLVQRNKIEGTLHLHTKKVYNTFYNSGIVSKKLLFGHFESLWKWYDKQQYIFDKKLFESFDTAQLTIVLYKFYEAFLQRLYIVEDQLTRGELPNE